MSRSYFKTALEVLSNIDDNVKNTSIMCYIAGIDSTEYDEILNSLRTWELIVTNGIHHAITKRGQNILSYYRTIETFSNGNLKKENKLREIRSRISNL